MNGDIEKLLNKVNYEIQKHINQGYDVEMLVPLEFDVSEWTLLLSYIEQLQNNWNELKNSLKDELNTIKTTCSQVNGNYFMMNDKIEWLEERLEQMQELGQGKDE